MSWAGFGVTSGKTEPKYWDPQFTKAKEELWKGNIDAATLTGLTSELQDIEKQAQEFARLGKQLEAELKISTAIENFSNKIKIKSVLQHGNSRILYIALVCILVLIFALGSYANGSHDAKNGKEYYVLSSNPQLVVLRTYGDNLICAPWYTETINGSNQSYVVKEYHIIKLDDVILTPKEIGPLKIAPEEYSANVSSSSP